MISARVYQGDCLELMKDLPDGSIDLVVTSPPYDNLRTYNGYSFDFEAIAAQLWRVVKPGGVVVWVVGDATVKGSESGTSFRQALFFKELGFNLHDTMIYQKTNYVPLTHNRYEQAFEYMFIFSKGRPKTFNAARVAKLHANNFSGTFYESDGALRKAHSNNDNTVLDKIRHNIWTYGIGSAKNGHPAVFPLQLATDHVASWSNAGDMVLDPFLGSGTTGVACMNLDRNFIGMELDQSYYDIACRRIQEACQSKGGNTDVK